MANFESNQINVKYIFILFLSLFLVSCNTTNPSDVKKSDTQRIKSIKYGNVVSSLPVTGDTITYSGGSSSGQSIGITSVAGGTITLSPGAAGSSVTGSITSSIEIE